MHTTHSPIGNAPASHPGLRGLWDGLAQRLGQCTPHGLIALTARLALAGIFWMSGRTKVEGVFTITDTTYLLFREEYKLPLIPPEWAAQMATVSEHLFPVLLVLGLATRLSGREQPLTGGALLHWLARLPLMTFGVVARIHWQALRLAIKRVPFFRKPHPPTEEISS